MWRRIWRFLDGLNDCFAGDLIGGACLFSSLYLIFVFAGVMQ